MNHTGQVPIDEAKQWPARVMHIPRWNNMSDRQKLVILRGVAEESARDPSFRAFVVNTVLAGVPDRAYEQQAAAMLAYVQRNIRYINEPDEQIQRPKRTLANGFGDCDDMAVLLAAMAGAVGLPWRFVLAGRRMGKPVRWVEKTSKPWNAQFCHIYVTIANHPFKPTGWNSAEPTLPNVPLGYDVVLSGIPDGHRSVGNTRQPASPLPELAGVFGLSGFYGAAKKSGQAASKLTLPSNMTATKTVQVQNPAVYVTEEQPASSITSAIYDGMVGALSDPDAWRDVAIGLLSGAASLIVVDTLLNRYVEKNV